MRWTIMVSVPPSLAIISALKSALLRPLKGDLVSSSGCVVLLLSY